jgi:hypothetical protein
MIKSMYQEFINSVFERKKQGMVSCSHIALLLIRSLIHNNNKHNLDWSTPLNYWMKGRMHAMSSIRGSKEAQIVQGKSTIEM